MRRLAVDAERRGRVVPPALRQQYVRLTDAHLTRCSREEQAARPVTRSTPAHRIDQTQPVGHQGQPYEATAVVLTGPDGPPAADVLEAVAA